MSLLSLLFSFNGRINRAQFWLGSAGVGVFGFIAVMALMFSAGVSALSAKTAEAALVAFASTGLLAVPVLMLVSWCGYALQVKRFHDRGRSGYLTLIPLAVAVPMMLTLLNGMLTGATGEALGQSLQPYVMASWLINIAFFIDLGCLPGKEGPNRFGNPPGAPRSATPYTPSNAAPTPAAPAANTLLSAQEAIDRAIAERARERAQPAKAAPRATVATSGAPAFGRRATR